MTEEVMNALPEVLIKYQMSLQEEEDGVEYQSQMMHYILMYEGNGILLNSKTVKFKKMKYIENCMIA